jgi:hypothetical protein
VPKTTSRREDVLPVKPNRLPIRRETGRQLKCNAGDLVERALETCARDAGCQPWRDDHAKIIVERKQPAIKRAIQQRVQANAVARVGTALDRITPRNDMAGHQQLGGGDAGEGAFRFVRRQNGSAEERLNPTRADDPLDLGVACGNAKLGHCRLFALR